MVQRNASLPEYSNTSRNGKLRLPDKGEGYKLISIFKNKIVRF